ncbi:hypothetical protein AVEN_163350-1 [Araneus ventricosus]|uniref:Uncharacterized protein n=1 Tax=Araneus ventricosus TaxID=182803 RepID=A0A4Y2FZ05_ARAVE|nr:hypothetical protein AVEN_163350-1 [Araneus ventricosus]
MAKHYTADHPTTEHYKVEYQLHTRLDRSYARTQLTTQIKFTVKKRNPEESYNSHTFSHNVSDQPHPVIRPTVSISHLERIWE